MPLSNPNKYIRQAYITALSGLNIPVWDKGVPADVQTPATYILIQSQTKTETQRNKCDKDWQVSTSVDIYDRSQRGFADSSVLDDIEQQITDALSASVMTDLAIPGFYVYNTFVDESVDAPQETPNETILHRALRFRVILGQ